MGAKRKRHTGEFKTKVALEAIRGVRTLSELSSMYGVHSTVIGQWKRQLVDGAAELFRRGNGAVGKSEQELTGPLYEEIGRLKVEVDRPGFKQGGDISGIQGSACMGENSQFQ